MDGIYSETIKAAYHSIGRPTLNLYSWHTRRITTVHSFRGAPGLTWGGDIGAGHDDSQSGKPWCMSGCRAPHVNTKLCYRFANRCKGETGVGRHSPVILNTGKQSISKMMINGVLGASF